MKSITGLSNILSRNDSFTPIEYEIEALSSIYPEQLERITTTNQKEIRILLKPNTNFKGEKCEGRENLKYYSNSNCWVKLLVRYNDGYPKIPPELEIYDKYNINNRELETLNEGVDEIAFSRSEEGVEMVFDICRYIEKFLDEKSKAYGVNIISVATTPGQNKINNMISNSPNVDNERGKRKLSPLPLNDIRRRKLSDTDNRSNTFSSANDKEKVRYIRKFLDDNDQNTDNDLRLSSKIEIDDLDTKKNKFQNFNSNDLIPSNSQHISRLHSDFEIIEKIGQGGGGSVYKVRHNIVKQLYAIKKIKLYTKKNPSKILKEVILLSRLQHPNIVRYYQAWYEDYESLKDDEKDENQFEMNSEEDECEEEEDSDETPEKSKSESNIKTTSEPVTITNGESDSESETLVVFEQPSHFDPKQYKNNVWEIEDDKTYCEKIKKEKESHIKYLIIQMEYCKGQTLREAIDKKLFHTMETSDKIKWKIIIQIIDALSYIHSKRLIHRDIKPPNIFLDEKYNVKLGDFGLATVSRPKTAIENLKSTQKEFLKFANNKDLLSCGIGTMYYCSPEQEKNNKYDQKTDMFSLGIVIFEMFYSFNSHMERDEVLRNIKDNHKFPRRFENISPDVVELVKKLTVKDPSLRPSSQELLNSNLVSRNYNEKTFLEDLDKMISENKSFYLRVVHTLFNRVENAGSDKLEKTVGNFLTRKESMLTDVIEENQTNYDYSLDDHFTKLKFLGQMNIKSFNFIFTTYSNICNEIKKFIKKENAEFIRLSETEAYSGRINVLDSTLQEILQVELYNENKFKNDGKENEIYNPENLMLTKTGDIVKTCDNIFSQIGKFFRKHFVGQNSPGLGVFPPFKLCTDAINTQIDTSGDRLIETNELCYSLIWGGSATGLFKSSKIIIDDDIVYEKSCIDLIMSIIEHFEMINNIQITINSSFILDYVFNRIKIIGEDKYNTLQYLEKVFNSRNKSIYSNSDKTTPTGPRDLLKLISSTSNNFSSFPIEKEKFKELLILLDTCWDFQNSSVNKKIDKRYETIYSEIQKINNLFERLLNEKGYINLRHKIKIDFSLIPGDLVFYSGVFFQIAHCENLEERIVICEGGRIDNHLNQVGELVHMSSGNSLSKTHSLVYRGFSIRFYTENIFSIKVSKLKEKDYNNFKIDFLIINNVDDSLKVEKQQILEYMFYVKNKCNELKFTSELIQAKQITTEFLDFFTFYRMKVLIILKFDEIEKKIQVEYKYKDKKRTVTKENFNLKEIIQSVESLRTKNK